MISGDVRDERELMPLLRRTAITVTAAAAVTGLLATPALAHTWPHVIKASGPTYTHDAAYSGVKTRIHVLTYKNKTVVWLKVSGFPEAAQGKTFGAHVHQNACGPAPTDSGGHYQNPDAPADTPVRDKEIWLDVKVGKSGRGHATAVAPWLITPGTAGSVVVHAETTNPDTGVAGGRLLCTTVPFGT